MQYPYRYATEYKITIFLSNYHYNYILIRIMRPLHILPDINKKAN